MTRDAAIEALRSQRVRLAKLGVLHAGVFGSTARGEAGPDSDVDVLVVLAPDDKRTVYDIVEIEHTIAEVVPGPVDVAISDHLKPAIKGRVLADALMAF